MNEVIEWQTPGIIFKDGSQLSDWVKVEESGVWHWQYDTHELTFDIYAHGGQFWKLYHARWATDNGEYAYGYGGQACRVILVKYKQRTRSPHSNLLMKMGDHEWVRTYEINEEIHTVMHVGGTDPRFMPDGAELELA